jgi:hypothetical protein
MNIIKVRKESFGVRHASSSTRASRKLVFESIGKRLGIGDNLEGWYKINEADLLRYVGSNVRRGLKRSSISNLLKSVYPEHSWDSKKFEHARSVSNVFLLFFLPIQDVAY